ncbi:hypothetical protein GJA_2563 [Janthinobacterium agaricidamnosum NBRC 102515 = DSM 9628]|uniref:Uncharacterized protein n=1 Tax=Janthinobacterium agaricidamnosum NBRC 102515 = DSM 9628 TaxID=1349767 RepID=W0V2Y1_9BURK|nr:hypothetical protein GJA_2563 [Janthinobacterium agaricidamnosum NBRC 102515 = DSM 9628]
MVGDARGLLLDKGVSKQRRIRCRHALWRCFQEAILDFLWQDCKTIAASLEERQTGMSSMR